MCFLVSYEKHDLNVDTRKVIRYMISASPLIADNPDFSYTIVVVLLFKKILI